MQLSEQQFKALFPKANSSFCQALNRAMDRFGIDSKDRVTAFLAQIGHESGGLTRLEEDLRYSAKRMAQVWPSRYAVDPKAKDKQPNALATRLAGNPQAIANNAYANRMGNGSEASGDGWRFRGRGLMMTTFRNNYAALGRAIGAPLEAQPEMLTLPEYAALSAAYFWKSNGLNALADAGRFQDIGSVINTGKPGSVPIGADDREQRWETAKGVLV